MKSREAVQLLVIDQPRPAARLRLCPYTIPTTPSATAATAAADRHGPTPGALSATRLRRIERGMRLRVGEG